MALPFLLTFAGAKLQGGAAAGPLQSIQAILHVLQADLSLPHSVVASIVPVNDRLVSVERSKADSSVFLLHFDEQFLATLEEEELKAVIAHELGHVWIFTHHPYIHTEALANRIASQLVSPENLEKVYQKVHSFQELRSSDD